MKQYAILPQQLVKKGWCKENAATINPKNNEIFSKRLPKKLKDFAHKRQIKRISTLLEPSIPFHTLIRHVDSEDIANEKKRTNDLALEINNVSIEDNINNKEPELDHKMVTQSGDPNNKSKPAYKKYCSYCHKNNHGISNCYQKQRDEEYQEYKNQRSRTPQQSFVQYFCSKPSNSQENRNENKNDFSSRDNDRTRSNQNNHSFYNDRYRNNDSTLIVQIIHKIITELTLDKDITIDLQVLTHLDPDMTIIIKEETHLDFHIDLPIETTLIIDTILDQDIDLVLNHKETLSSDTIMHTDLHPDQEIIDQDLEHLHKTDNKKE